MAKVKCTSCSVGLTGDGFVRFKCPKCAKAEIVRCPVCRRAGRNYICAVCGFEGP